MTIRAEFLNILRASQPGLLRTARRILRDDAEAEDIIQEVAVFVLSSPNLLEGVENVAAWLTTLVYRRSVDLLRKLGRRRFLEDEEKESLPSGQALESEVMEERELIKAIAAAIESLPGELRFAFAGNTLDGKPFRRLSEASGIPMGTLMARKQRAVRLIREELNRNGLLG